MTLEGRIEVRLAWDGARVRDVGLRSTRPFAANRLLAGKSGADAATTLPILYSICARAQGVAALGAVEAAEGRAATQEDLAGRELAVALEAIDEYLRRILIDWPETMGHPAATASVAAARRRITAVGASRANLARVLSEIVAECVYGEAPADWLERIEAEPLESWARRGATLPAVMLAELLDATGALGTSDVALMPSSTSSALAAAVLPALRSREDYERAPLWNGEPVETGALARMSAHPGIAAMRARLGNTVATRMSARLAELALLVRTLDACAPGRERRPWHAAFTPEAGEGISAVQTARGLLLHRALVSEGRIAAYQIVAPTEWNFHPDGAAAHALATLRADDAAMLARRARLAVQALDPCVAFEIRVADA
jgi:coenzyme F420-reducing hydrogenase alpha subunit